MNRQQVSILVLFLCSAVSVFLLSSCFLSPQETVTYVVANPGKPVIILTLINGKVVRVKGQDMETGKVIEDEDISGWVAMPRSHWKVIAEKLGIPAEKQ